MMTLREVLGRYATLRDLNERTVVIYGQSIDRFGIWLGHTPTVADLDEMKVASFVQWRATNTRGKSQRPISAETVTKDRTVILLMWSFACKKRLHPTGEWAVMPKRCRVIRTPDAYTAEDIQRLVIAARYCTGRIHGIPRSIWWPGIIMVLFQTGERIGAVMATRWQDIDLERGWIRFLAENRKGHAADNVKKITPDLCRWLSQMRREPGDLVWPWDRLEKSIYGSWRGICRKAGVRSRAFHGLRKSSCSYVHLGGGDATAHAMHADPRMTAVHYLSPAITGKGSAVGLLPKVDLGPMPTGAEEPADGEEAEFIPAD